MYGMCRYPTSYEFLWAFALPAFAFSDIRYPLIL
jgi:hypothetical protein